MLALSLAALLAAAPAPAAAPSGGLSVEQLVELNRLGEFVPSPDGRLLAYTVKQPGAGGSGGSSDIWLLDLHQPDSAPRQLTNHPAAEANLQWSRDGRQLLFLAARGDRAQIWALPLDGGEPAAVSDLPVDVEGFVLAPDGQTLALALTTRAGCPDLACGVAAAKALSEQQSSGRLYDSLMVRHWDSWLTPLNRHLFVARWQGEAIRDARDLTPELTSDIPSRPFGGFEEIQFSPDSRSLIYAAKANGAEQAWQTNFDLYQVSVDGGPATNLTAANLAWDNQPQFSPDGKQLYWLAMKRPGFEADRHALMVRDLATGTSRELLANWDRSIDQFLFSADGRSLYLLVQDVGQSGLYRYELASGKLQRVMRDGTISHVAATGERLLVARHALNAPTDLYQLPLAGGAPVALTRLNEQKLAGITMAEFQQFDFAGWNNETVYGYWLKPVGYQKGKKYPVAFIVHGGPQGSFGNMFHYRWNAQLWAAQGYGVVMIDFHGSTGYGQAFTDSISRDWGGKPLEDLKKGMAAITAAEPWLDGSNACALGASYGGYMVNWIAGNWSDGFKCLVNHAGLFDMPGFYATTEELWFPEYEWGGPVWQSSDDYQKFNPASLVDNWRTPVLVIHGEKDFRVPYDQGLAAFTTLQRKGIPSRLLMFPDENHWILKPANLIQWYNEVFRWQAEWTKP